MFVYVIVCSETLKIYVGQHKGPDLGKYLSKKWFDAHRYAAKRSHLYAAMRKHPRDSWSIHPLVSGIEDKKELDETEQLLIYALNAQHPDVGYNICDGGEGFTGIHTEEWKRQLSARMKGHPVSEETRIAIGQSYGGFTPARQKALNNNRPARSPWLPHGRPTGFEHTEETLMKMRESAKARGISQETRQKMVEARKISEKCRTHPNYTTLEGIEKMRAAKKGRPWSAARRAAYENKTSDSTVGG